jgi:hypothetical protein
MMQTTSAIHVTTKSTTHIGSNIFSNEVDFLRFCVSVGVVSSLLGVLGVEFVGVIGGVEPESVGVIGGVELESVGVIGVVGVVVFGGRKLKYTSSGSSVRFDTGGNGWPFVVLNK